MDVSIDLFAEVSLDFGEDAGNILGALCALFPLVEVVGVDSPEEGFEEGDVLDAV